MKQIHNIKLQTNSEHHQLSLLGIRKVTNDGLYRCEIDVRSRGFSCKYHFHISRSYLVKAIADLKAMSEDFDGEAVLSEDYGLSEVKIQINELGQIMVSGIITESDEFSQKFEFGFGTDQTVLQPLINDLELVRALPLSSART